MTAQSTPHCHASAGPDAAPEAASEPVCAPPAPDPSVSCPLCHYDLRGLTEPRCPECGYRFEWDDLRNPAKRLHPYLFEHHPRRNLWSFVRTMLEGFRPVRFWASLKPSQPSRPGRLVLYWLIASQLLPLGYAGFFTYAAINHAKQHESNRRFQLISLQRYLASPPSQQDSLFAAEVRNAGGPLAWVDVQLPPTRSPRYLLYVYQRKFEPHIYPNAEPGHHLEVFLVLLAWPWLTLATLLIFRASMRRAKVHTIHVLRCALYCCDASLWLGMLATLAVPWVVSKLDLGRYIGFRDAAAAAPVFALVTAWRLSAAYRHYLQFDHPAATAAASQVLVMLTVWVLLYTGAL